MKIALLAFALALAQEKDDTDAKLKDFADAMKSAKSDAERIKAIDTLAATRSLKAAMKLATVVGSPYPEAVRVAAADAVGKIGDVKAGAPLLAYVNTLGNLLQSEVPSKKDEQKVAEAAVRAIGTLRDRSATSRLTGMLISANIPLMGEAVRALGKIRDPQCMDGLLKLHYAANAPEGVGATNVRKPLAVDTLWTLRRITGQRLSTPDEWNKWYRSVGGRVVVAPEESLGGLPPEVKKFAVYGGKGEIATLRHFDLVLLNPENYAKEELSNLFRPIALGGDPKAAMDKGFAGFVCEPEQASDLRKKFPRALIVAHGGAKTAASAANAILVDDLDLQKPDVKVLDELRDAYSKSDTATLALFVSDKKEDLAAAAALDKKHAFLYSYVSPDLDHSTITAPAAP
ncbi:MAG TPA: HEAT repeat domain-containing protein [Planctomycetota bacterium]|nr:HEAT repeat domain-containing protein [Planctomycetota bacterium]